MPVAWQSRLEKQSPLDSTDSNAPITTDRSYNEYWVSADATEIWASPTTITGSIGIFGAIPTVGRSLASIGIYSDGIQTAPVAGATNLTRSLSSESKSLIQQSIEYGYKQFIDIVATGRNLKTTKVEEIAAGRVYSGIKAQEIGLVDELGNLDDTIESLASHLELNDYNVLYLEKEQDMRQQILRAFTTSVFHTGLESLIGKTGLGLITTSLDELPLLKTSPDPMGVYVYSGEYRL